MVGDLQKPQTLKHVPSSLIEIGITRYENEAKLEAPYKHKQAFEFQYVTTGLTAYLDLGTGAEHVFGKGDFYVIEPGVTYAQKSAAGTEILFIKVPPGNDSSENSAVGELQCRPSGVAARHLILSLIIRSSRAWRRC